MIAVQPTAYPTSLEPAGEHLQFLPGIAVPLPDEAAAFAAWERLSSIDIGVSAPTIAGLGMLAEAVAFVAGVQAHPFPRPILSTRVVLVTGSHAGGLVAGAAPDPRNAVPLQQLASAAGAGIVTLEWQPASAAIEFEDAITPEQMDTALRAGWAEAERAADEGIEMLILAAGGAGASSAAVAVISAISGYEATALLGRVVTPAGIYDDNAWMTRCLALRDAMHRVRHRDGDPRTVLSALGGADLAAATGLLLGAASRRLPVMIDGPVGAAAAMLANDFAPAVRRWLMLPDAGRNVALIVAAEALELRPWLDLCLDLGEGATSLSALPLLQMALTLAGAGEPVEPGPLTRFDSSTGGQVFVGVARPVEPAEAEEAAGRGEVGAIRGADGPDHEHRSEGEGCRPPGAAQTRTGQGRAAQGSQERRQGSTGQGDSCQGTRIGQNRAQQGHRTGKDTARQGHRAGQGLRRHQREPEAPSHGHPGAGPRKTPRASRHRPRRRAPRRPQRPGQHPRNPVSGHDGGRRLVGPTTRRRGFAGRWRQDRRHQGATAEAGLGSQVCGDRAEPAEPAR